MTELTGSEVIWASSQEGKAQLRAAWQAAARLGLNLSMADVGALLWAAREAGSRSRVLGLTPYQEAVLRIVCEAGDGGIPARDVRTRMTGRCLPASREAVHRWLGQHRDWGLIRTGKHAGQPVWIATDAGKDLLS